MKYRKKPAVIEAVKFEYSKNGIEKVRDFCGSAARSFGKSRHMGAIGWAEIVTLEDSVEGSPKAKHIAQEGDYIIKGISGEFYPCKPDIFHATYEEVEE